MLRRSKKAHKFAAHAVSLILAEACPTAPPLGLGDIVNPSIRVAINPPWPTFPSYTFAPLLDLPRLPNYDRMKSQQGFLFTSRQAGECSDVVTRPRTAKGNVVVGLAAAIAAPKIVFAQPAGVAIDAAGVVQLKSTADQSGRLSKEQQAAARAGLNTQAAKRSVMRCISLKHLEKAIREKNGEVTDEMRYLAGLLRVRYVFFYPESGDIVIAGPAEGWTTDPAGRTVGISSGRPVIRLDDLCVALRAFPPGGSATHSSAARSIRRRMAWPPCSGSSGASVPTPIPATRSGRSSSSRACRAISACRA